MKSKYKQRLASIATIQYIKNKNNQSNNKLIKTINSIKNSYTYKNTQNKKILKLSEKYVYSLFGANQKRKPPRLDI